MVTIRSKTQVSSPAGTEAIPIETAALGDGWLTAQQIANLGLPVYNVKTPYGATGNGSTDDSTACQNAINACAAGGGGIVFFPAGNYYCPSGLVVSSGGVHLCGVGGRSLSPTVTSGSVISVGHNPSASPVTFQGTTTTDLTQWFYDGGLHNIVLVSNYSGVGTSNTTPGLVIKYAGEIHVSDVSIINFGRGVYMSATLGSSMERVFVESGALSLSTAIGFYLSGSLFGLNSLRFWGCSATMTGASTNIGWYLAEGTIADVFFNNCEADGNTYAVLVDGSGIAGPAGLNDIFIDHMVADQCVVGIAIQNVATSSGAIDIDGGNFVASTSGAIGVLLSSASGVRVRGVQMYSNQASSTGVSLSSATDCAITDCSFKGAWTNAIAGNGSAFCSAIGNDIVQTVTASGTQGVGITGACHHMTFVGNKFRSVSGSLGTAFAIVNTCHDIALGSNVVESGSVTTALSASGASNVRAANNIGITDQ